MTRKSSSLLAVCLLPLAGCITQEVNLCPTASPALPDGSLMVVPEWKENDLNIYLEWLSDEDQRWKVEAFQETMACAIRRDLGEDFPHVSFPPVTASEAVALGLWGGDYKDIGVRSATPSEPPPSAENASRDVDLGAIEDAFRDALHAAVHANNELMYAADFHPLQRQVSYVVEQGVTYCIYKSWIVMSPTPTSPRAHWWQVSWTDPDGTTITAYLDLMAVVKRIG